MARTVATPGRLRKVGAEIGVEGIDEIKAKIARKLDKLTGLEAKKVFMRAALKVVREAKDLAPVKTGRLRSAIFADYGDPKKPNVLVGVQYQLKGGEPRAPHAHLVEYGHGGPQPAPPHPFMAPAVAATRNIVAADIVQGLKDLVEKE